jgi:hypothetical protein
METWRHRHGDVETWRQWRHGDIETWRHGGMEAWRHGHADIDTSNGTWILNPFTVSSSCKLRFVVCQFFAKKQTEVIRLQTD